MPPPHARAVLVALHLNALDEGTTVIPIGILFIIVLINSVGGAVHHILDSLISIAIWKVMGPVIRSLKVSDNIRKPYGLWFLFRVK